MGSNQVSEWSRLLISNQTGDIALIRLKIVALEKARKTCTDSKVKMAIDFCIAAEKRKLTFCNLNQNAFSKDAGDPRQRLQVCFSGKDKAGESVLSQIRFIVGNWPSIRTAPCKQVTSNSSSAVWG